VEIVEMHGFVPPCEGLALSLGFFDGIHIGHRKLIDETVKFAAARRIKSAFFTFSDHPQGITIPDNRPRLLSTFEEKIELVSGLGVDYFIWTDFTESFRETGAADFVGDMLAKRMNARALWAGTNYHFGFNAEGDAEMLKELGAMHGISVFIEEPVLHCGEVVSSSLIRKCISEGNVEKASVLLGSAYSLSCSFRHSGRETSQSLWELECDREKLIPPKGVYRGRIVIAEETRGTIIYTGLHDLASYLAVTPDVPFKRVNGEKLRISFSQYLSESGGKTARAGICDARAIDGE